MGKAKLEMNIGECVDFVKACGASNTAIIMGPPGTGKSQIGVIAAKDLGRRHIYIDVPLYDPGDIQIPKIGEESMRFVLNEIFMHDEPVVITFDEIGKAPRMMQNVTTTAINEHRFGEFHFHPDTIVLATTNLSTDGVGDNVPAHLRNRATIIHMKNTGADDWNVWGIDNGVDPAVMAFVHEFPHVFASYTDYEDAKQAKDNLYIYNPTMNQVAFASHRSMERASHIVKQRDRLTENSLIVALAGTIGEPAARDLLAYISMQDSLPPWDAIMANPKTCAVPDNPIACVIQALGSIPRLDDKKVLGKWMEYLMRLPSEVQYMWAAQVMRSSKAGMVGTFRPYTKWCQEVSWAV